LREAYNAKLGLTRSVRAENKAVVEKRIGARSPQRWHIPHLSHTQSLLVLVLLLLAFGTYFGYTRWEASRVWPTGSYLLSIDNGQPEAVILGRVSDHVDFSGRRVPAYRIKNLKTGQITWVTDKPAHAQWQLGNPAPASLLEETK
jgi:hypothetical protein